MENRITDKDIIDLLKMIFFKELFYGLGIETVFMRIREENIRSRKTSLLRIHYTSRTKLPR